MSTMNSMAKEDQPCNPKMTLSKGEFVFRLLFILPSLLSSTSSSSSSSLLLFFCYHNRSQEPLSSNLYLLHYGLESVIEPNLTTVQIKPCSNNIE